MNEVWLTKIPQYFYVFEAGGCSDHLQCRFQIQLEPLKTLRPFKFTNAVAEAPGFIPLIADYWRSADPLYNSTSALFRLSKKLKDLKPALRDFSKQNNGDITKRTREAYDTLCKSQTLVMTDLLLTY